MERFGTGVLTASGHLDRAALASIVFQDPEALRDLNAIVHPAVRDEMARSVDRHRGSDRVVVLDIPLLAENPRRDLAATIVVDTPVEIAVERLVRSGAWRKPTRGRGSPGRRAGTSGGPPPTG